MLSVFSVSYISQHFDNQVGEDISITEFNEVLNINHIDYKGCWLSPVVFDVAERLSSLPMITCPYIRYERGGFTCVVTSSQQPPRHFGFVMEIQPQGNQIRVDVPTHGLLPKLEAGVFTKIRRVLTRTNQSKNHDWERRKWGQVLPDLIESTKGKPQVLYLQR